MIENRVGCDVRGAGHETVGKKSFCGTQLLSGIEHAFCIGNENFARWELFCFERSVADGDHTVERRVASARAQLRERHIQQQGTLLTLDLKTQWARSGRPSG